MASYVKDIFSGAGRFVVDKFETVLNVGETVSRGVTEVVEYIKNAFNSLNNLIEIFPLECKVLLVSFFTVASVYLVYKIVRGG